MIRELLADLERLWASDWVKRFFVARSPEPLVVIVTARRVMAMPSGREEIIMFLPDSLRESALVELAVKRDTLEPTRAEGW